MDRDALILPGIFVVFIGVMLFNFIIGMNVGRAAAEREAVQQGVAVYCPSPDGSPVFTWIKCKS